MPILSGLGSYIASTIKAQKDIGQLREQNKLDIDRLMSQHKLDLESLERKHQMDVEKMEIEHKHKIELMQKEMENKVGTDLTTEMIAQLMNAPAFREQINKSVLQGFTSGRKKK
jgi:hypothetical protein